MRKIQMILLGVFLGGVLLGGVGTGVALVEYSSLTYEGERHFGEENLVTRELDYIFSPEEERIRIMRGYWEDFIEEDEHVPEGIVRYEVTYNEKTVEPSLRFWEGNISEEDRWGQEEYGEEKEESLSVPEESKGSEKALRQICLELHVNYLHSDEALFMECKDEILAALKDKKIYQYDVVYVSDLKIKVNPKTMPYIEEPKVMVQGM